MRWLSFSCLSAETQQIIQLSSAKLSIEYTSLAYGKEEDKIQVIAYISLFSSSHHPLIIIMYQI